MADWLSAFGLSSASAEAEAKPATSTNGTEQKKPPPAKSGDNSGGAKTKAAAAKKTNSADKSEIKPEDTRKTATKKPPAPTANGTTTPKASGSTGKKDGAVNGVEKASNDKVSPTPAKKGEKAPPQKSDQGSKKVEATKSEESKRESVSGVAPSDSIEQRQAAAAAAAAAAGVDAGKKSIVPSANSTSAASVAKAAALRRIRVTEALPELVSQAQACVYEPAEFFVAWQGVLTIIYSGIPPSLCKLKSKMTEQFPSLPPENPGSLWPKTSLACLKDDKRLSPEQLQQLRDICSKMNFQLVYSPVIRVNSVSVVIYENCCLEKQLISTHIQLQQPEDLSPVSEEQRAHVRKVADEFSQKNINHYWFHVSKDGNRSKHYRQSKAGATLVHFLGDEIPPSVATFQKLVEAAMPGMYDWFPPESLHITLRSLC